MESKIKKSFLIIFAVLFIFVETNLKLSLGYETPAIRVAVLKDVSEFELSIRGRFKLLDPLSNQVLKEERTFPGGKVYSKNNGIYIKNEFYPLKRLKIISSKDVTIAALGKSFRYRDTIEIILGADNKFTVINVLDLETYTKGVLYHEVSHRWPMEAVKAQAVATRTYALYQSTIKKDQLYDVSSDIYSQVYGGRSAERYRTNIAANRTRGQILMYDGKILPAYFHATCGGHTENVKELWEHDDLPPLKGIVCLFCQEAPYHRWKTNFRSQDVQMLLNKNGYKLDLIKEIKVLEKTESGRAKTLLITTRNGKTANISGKKFREIIGPNILKSNFFDIEMKGYYFDILGQGWGHGVGMCQWGAYFMSRQRYKYREILNFYYPGAEIVDYLDH